MLGGSPHALMRAIERYAPAQSVYISDAQRVADDDGALQWKAEQLCAVVVALREDYEAGGMQTVAELLHADLFDDFLELAGELLDKGYVPPAAVVAGSVLEEHLRKLADTREIARLADNGRPKSVETLSIDLRKADELSDLDRKSVQAWYGYRNGAAHGQAETLVAGDVERMIAGIRDFIARRPALFRIRG